MRINNNITINTFKGINVNNKEYTKEDVTRAKTEQVRPRQAEALKNLEQKLKLIQDTERQTKLKSIAKIDSDAEGRNLGSRFIRYIGVGTGEDLYNDKKDGVEKEKNTLEAKSLYADRMLNLVESTIKDIRKIDIEEAKKYTTNPDVIIEDPKKEGIKNIAGYEVEKSVLKSEFIDKVKKEQNGEDVNIFGSILFFGPYGNGKTYITDSVARETDCNVVEYQNAGRKNKNFFIKRLNNIGEESEKNFNENKKRTIIFVDEIDRLLEDNPNNAEQFEDFIKNCSTKYHCTVFAATNNPLNLNLNFEDKNVFPVKMSIDPPNKENAIEVFKYHIAKYPHGEINYEELEKNLRERENKTDKKFNNGRIKQICDKSWQNKNSEQISQNDIINAINIVEPELSEQLQKKFENDYNNLIAEKKEN